MHATLPLLVRTDFPALRRRTVDTLQINLGYRCNQSCLHCHVNAGPNRTEEMSRDTIDAVIAFLAANPDVRTLDLTGGAPELNRNRDAMISEGLIKAADSVVFWTSDPLPNDAVAVRAELSKDAAFVARLRAALEAVGPELRRTPNLLPPRYTGFVAKDNAYYRPIRDAGLATGKLSTQ
jgi:ABC-type phosphate/phosphonate transport system substrate-binding protein